MILPSYRAAVLLGSFGTLRLGEVLAFRRRHLDLEAGTVTVVEQMVTLDHGERLITEPKSEAGRRTVALPKLVLDALAEHLASYVKPDEDALLYTSSSGGLLPVGTFYPHYRKARQAIGHPELRFHDLRHAAGTMAAWTGATTKELMARRDTRTRPLPGGTSTSLPIGTAR